MATIPGVNNGQMYIYKFEGSATLRFTIFLPVRCRKLIINTILICCSTKLFSTKFSEENEEKFSQKSN